jgi:Mrp family chromosome partitioning ATPase
LRSIIAFSQAGHPPTGTPSNGQKRAHITLVVSACAGDGKTTVTANLAAAMVEAGKRVVAVNSDFRRPMLSKQLIDNPVSLPFALEDLATVPIRQLLQRTQVTNLVMLDLAGVQGSPGGLARATARLLPEVASLCDEIVIDSSPVGVTAEVLDLLPIADTVVVVMRLDHTVASPAERTMEMLRSLAEAPLLLTLVGDAGDRSPYYEYGHRAPRRERVKAGTGQG